MNLPLIALASLVALPVQAALIASWNQNERPGPFAPEVNIIDRTGGHPPGVPALAAAVAYNEPGVPNGTYGSITVLGAFGTSIAYGPNSSDDFFVVGVDNNNPVMNILNTGAFTAMAWINPLAPDIVGRSYRPISTGSGDGADGGWGLALRFGDVAGTATSVRFTSYGIADNDSATFPVTFGFGNWIHIAATYNNGAIDYYLNGDLLGGSDTSVFRDELAAARLTVGARFGGNDFDQTNGRLDGIRVYNEVLSAAQIRSAAIASVIPEPTAACLVFLGAAGLTRRRRMN